VSNETYEMTDNQEMFDYFTTQFNMTADEAMRTMEENGRFDNEEEDEA